MNRFLNFSTYKFTPLSHLKPLREELIERCKAWKLKGTILLSAEGINLFVAGPEVAMTEFLEFVRAIPGLADLEAKISESDHQPFTRMLVRIKKEIIAFGVEGIEPGRRTSPKLPPKELKKWLDEGREITLLDTRNDYEIKLGTFKNALPIGIQQFRKFPAAVAELPEDLKKRPIVMFCTGGIRCEKAGPYMESQGFEQIYQLDGGILKYFEECGSAHYDGDCFVFDQRVGLDPSLQESPTGQCFNCLAPLTVDDQKDPRYIEGRSCSYCYVSSEAQMQMTLDKRHRQIAKLIHPLPGSEPYANLRPLKVPNQCEGMTFLEFVSRILKHVPQETWLTELEANNFQDKNYKTVTKDHIVHSGERYFHLTPVQSEPEVNADIRIIYEDGAMVVIDKPAPLAVHPCGRFNRNTLQYFLNELYSPQHPRPAHRLDANTTGLMVIARTKHIAGILQPQFMRGDVEKGYLARVHGHPDEDAFECSAPIAEFTQDVGARSIDEDGMEATTHFRVLRRFEDGTSLLEVRPITGRTNQIRVHLWHLGFPIVGDQLYLPNQKFGQTQTGALDDAPLCLRAQRLSFLHPVTRERVQFDASRQLDWFGDFSWEQFLEQDLASIPHAVLAESASAPA